MKYKNIIKKSIPLALAGGLLVGSALYPAHEAAEEPTVEETIAAAGITLPERMTPEKPLLGDPTKEYSVFSELYTAFTNDGELDTHEITALEHVLSRTILELQHKTERAYQMKSKQGRDHFYLTERMAKDLKELRKHLKAKEEWISTTEGKYWHHGFGASKYLADLDEGNIRDLESVFEPKGTYLLNVVYNKYPDVVIKTFKEDHPWEDRIPWGAGLLLGGFLPVLFGYASRKLRGENLFDARKQSARYSDIINAVLNPAAGIFLLDGIHPLVYPIRLAASIIYPYVFHTRNRKPKKYKKPLMNKPKVKPKIINPWKVEIPEIENILKDTT